MSLSYPIGKYTEQPFSRQQLEEWLSDIRALPVLAEYAILNLDEVQLNTPYREDGWTITQVIHHLADSHMNAYIRFKTGLTEEKPVIKPYDEKAWALLPDINDVPVNISITLLHALHRRWVALLETLQTEDFKKEVYHPEHKTHMDLWYLLGMYAWHSRHHVAHITQLRDRMGWK